MGPFRRGVALALALPNAAWSEACNKTRPDWDGSAVSALDEALYLAATPATLVLILGSMIAVRFRHQWGALAVVVLWTLLVSMVAMGDPTGLRAQEIAEGCIGSPALFIAAVAAICVGMIIYTTPKRERAE